MKSDLTKPIEAKVNHRGNLANVQIQPLTFLSAYHIHLYLFRVAVVLGSDEAVVTLKGFCDC